MLHHGERGETACAVLSVSTTGVFPLLQSVSASASASPSVSASQMPSLSQSASPSASFSSAPTPQPCSIVTIAGTGVGSYTGDAGPATSATLRGPSGVSVVASTGNILWAEETNCVIRVLFADSGIVQTLVGAGTSCSYAGDNGPAPFARLNCPSDVFALSSPAGAFLIADQCNNRIRLVESDGWITTWAGTGTGSSSGDGQHRTLTAFKRPAKIAVQPSTADVFVTGDSRVRRINAVTGIVTTVIAAQSSGATAQFVVPLQFAYAVTFSVPGWSPGPSAALPPAVGDEVVILSDRNASTVLLFNLGGSGSAWTRLAGNGSATSTGDGQPAVNATIDGPSGLLMDAATGDVIIGTYSGRTIRRVSGSSGTTSTIAGTGATSPLGDGGSPRFASFTGISGLAWVPSSPGALLVADFDGQRIRMLSPGCLPRPTPVRAYLDTKVASSGSSC